MASTKTPAQIAAEKKANKLRREKKKAKLQKMAKGLNMEGKVAARFVANGLALLPK